MKRLVGLVGYAGNGKGVAATALVEEGFVLLKFADPLKAMLRTLLAIQGLDAEMIERMIEGDLKEVPAAELNGMTPRYAMQTLGTEWGRELISPTFWIDIFRRRAKAAMFAGHDVVVDDVRFVNEGKAVRMVDGELVRIVRPDRVADLQHKSEREIQEIDCDYTVVNDKDIPSLRNAVLELVREQ